MTDNIEYTGFKTISTVEGKKDQDGFWEVIATVEAQRSKDLENWEAKDVSIKSIDKDVDRAIKTATVSINAYLESVKGNLFDEDDKKEATDVISESVEAPKA